MFENQLNKKPKSSFSLLFFLSVSSSSFCCFLIFISFSFFGVTMYSVLGIHWDDLNLASWRRCWIRGELLTAQLFSVHSSRRLCQNWMKMTLATSSVGRDLPSTELTSTSCTTSMNPQQTALTSLWWPSCPWTGTLHQTVSSYQTSAPLQSCRFLCVSHAAQASDVGGHL